MNLYDISFYESFWTRLLAVMDNAKYFTQRHTCMLNTLFSDLCFMTEIEKENNDLTVH